MLQSGGVTPFIRPATVRHADRQIARSIALLLLVVFTATMVTQPDILDGELEFQTTRALARDSTLAIGGTPEAEALKSFEVPDGQGGTRRGFNGRWGGPGREHEFFSWFGVGQAYVGVPLYLVGAWFGQLFPVYDERHSRSMHMGVPRSEYFEHLFVGWRNPLLSALTAALIALAARRLGASRRSSLLAGLSYGLCTFAWPQARSTLNGVQATFLLFLAFYQVLVIEEAFARLRRPSKGALLLCGLALGGAFLTRPVLAPAVVVVALAAFLVLRKGYLRLPERMTLVDMGWIAVPAFACFGVFLWTNQVRFGDPVEQGYGGIVTWESYFNYPLHHGLAGILFSPGQGLFWMAPGALLALFWVRRLVAERAWRMPLLLLALGAAVLVPVCLTVGWHGAWGYGPRYALPLLPFLWLGVGPVLDSVSKSAKERTLALCVLGAGFLVALPGALVDTTTHTDLALQAARLEWPDVEGNEATREEERFQRIRWDLRFAAPAAHWRILRHRVAGLEEEYRAEDLFFLDPEKGSAVLVPEHDREKGFQHLAWVDFVWRLAGPMWAHHQLPRPPVRARPDRRGARPRP